LNLSFLGARAGGVGRYARELPGALLAVEPETEIVVFIAGDSPLDLRDEPWAEHVRWCTLPLAAGSRQLALAQYLALPALAAVRRLDVLHSPGNAGPVITPGVASVVSLMDLIWLRRADEWDPDPRAQRAMRRWVNHSVRHADRVFAISRAAADDFTASLGLEPARIVVTPLGVRPSGATAAPESEIRRRLDLGGSRVLLCIGQKRQYKNQERLIRSLASLDPDVILVLPGSRTGYEDRLRDTAAELGVSSRVRMPDWLSEAELAGLYTLSDVFALPSLIEGFGLPVLEAMVHGLPVACSDIPALREVCGEAALLFDPEDQKSIDWCLQRLLTDVALRRRLTRRGHDHARTFSWENTARASFQGYRAAVSASH
jgi:glycosyltransferase involved in cell wall biosynthesis